MAGAAITGKRKDECILTFEEAKLDCKRRPLTDFIPLEKSKKGMYCCPICGSGKGPHKTGALKIDPETYHVTCFSGKECFGKKGEDTPGALTKVWNCNLAEALRRAGYQIDNQQSAPAPRPKKQEQPKQIEQADYTEQYKVWNGFLLQDQQALDYLHGRGINDDSIKHFMLGYAPEWVHPSNMKYSNPKKEARIIIPRSRGAYSARSLDPDAPDKYKVIDQKHLFNVDGMQYVDSKDPIVVVEGELDAIAIWQYGYEKVVALGSTNNKDLFIETAKQINPAAVYILALDNDPADSKQEGQKTQAYIADQLDKAGIAYISADVAALYGEAKDAGEAYLKDADASHNRLYPYLEGGYNMRVEREKAAELEAYTRSGPGMVDSFLQVVSDPDERAFEPIPSGIQSLDSALGGGFIRQSVIMVGAAPGMGKTVLISQICENIAKNGWGDILYLNLEMSREVLLARSIARIANRGRDKAITVSDILQGYRWDEDTRRTIQAAADEYKRTVAGHLIYNPGVHDTRLEVIKQKIEDEKRRLGHAPIVVIDYLQLITSAADDDPIAVIRRTMQDMKDYANDNKTLVFMITANNRSSMRTGESGLNSGRDSSNIEYGADLHCGIEYEKVSDTITGFDEKDGELVPHIEKGKDLSFIGTVKKAYNNARRKYGITPVEDWNSEDRMLADLYKQYCTGYVVRINKNRAGDSEITVPLTFDGASARFIERDYIH